MPAFRQLAKRLIQAIGYQVRKLPTLYADPAGLDKAKTFIERYREVISDPLNILIQRVAESGYVDAKGYVILHNGHRVPATGNLAYYNDFSDILIINRGVHEPLEEYCFQQMLLKLKASSPVMIELGAYWAHYSMWLLKYFPDAQCILVEPNLQNIACGENNFRLNKYYGEFIPGFVGMGHLTVDSLCSARRLARLHVLHSDIQGYEVEMLQGAERMLSTHKVDYVFISTHSQVLHNDVVDRLKLLGYHVEVSSGYDLHTTSSDGFVLASGPDAAKVFDSFTPMGRQEIAQAAPRDLVASINRALSE